MKILKNVRIDKEIKDLLIGGEKILQIQDHIDVGNLTVEVIDCEGKRVVPGFIDTHVHLTGGGGEGSFKTRVSEITLSPLVRGGITTVVGLLGTDDCTRSIETLVAKTKALKEEGLTAYCLTGAYGYPSVTLTGSGKKDIVFIEEVIGTKIAVNDHRSPSITASELSRLASDSRVAGMLSGKPGIVIVHMGDGKKRFELLREVLEQTDLPIQILRPTHVNRNRELFQEAIAFALDGGLIDLTCGRTGAGSPTESVKEALEKGVPCENITISSDGYGSWSTYDEKGQLLKMGVASVSALHEEFITMAKSGFSVEDALPYFTKNVAKSLDIYPQKGVLQEGSDADIIVLNQDLSIHHLFARGQHMLCEGEVVVKGSYE